MTYQNIIRNISGLGTLEIPLTEYECKQIYHSMQHKEHIEKARTACENCLEQNQIPEHSIDSKNVPDKLLQNMADMFEKEKNPNTSENATWQNVLTEVFEPYLTHKWIHELHTAIKTNTIAETDITSIVQLPDKDPSETLTQQLTKLANEYRLSAWILKEILSELLWMNE